jgi:hypothetical protein
VTDFPFTTESLESIDQKRGTTQIVSDAFSFLKDVDISEEVCNKRRSSGYKSSHFPDDDMLGVTNDGIDKSDRFSIFNIIT